MAENINLNKVIRDREDFVKVIDTSFSQINQAVDIQNPILTEPSVGDFFNMYNNLFYQIPQNGPLSHTSLIEQSGEYVSYDAVNDSLVAAQEEINLLRTDLLEANSEINDLNIQIVEILSKANLSNI